MDASKLETFTLTFQRQSPTLLNASLSAKVLKGVDVPELWKELRPQILSDPAMAGFAQFLVVEREDVNVNLSKGTLQATLPCAIPAAKKG